MGDMSLQCKVWKTNKKCPAQLTDYLRSHYHGGYPPCLRGRHLGTERCRWLGRSRLGLRKDETLERAEGHQG